MANHHHDGGFRPEAPEYTAGWLPKSDVGDTIKEEFQLSKPVCRLCSKSFANGSVLNRHLKKIHGLASTDSEFGPRECERCHRSFKRRGDLTRHKCQSQGKGQVKNKKVRNIPCEYEGCKYRCTALSELKRHSCKHTGVKEFICTYCSKEFTQRQVLQIHVRTHILEKPFKCQVIECEFQSHRKDLLNLHIWTKHPSMRSRLSPKTQPLYIPCPFCKQAVQKIALEIHLRTHTNERPFACEFCDHRTRTLASLRDHIVRVHTIGSKLFSCIHCDKAFRFEGDLRQHAKYAHGDKNVPGRYAKCTICSSKIIRDHAMRRHYFLKHGIDLSVYVTLSKCDAQLQK